MKIGGQKISGVIWDDFCVNFKLDQVFVPGNYTFEIYQVINGDEFLIENLCEITEVFQVIADHYYVDYSGLDAISIFEEGLLSDIDNNEY